MGLEVHRAVVEKTAGCGATAIGFGRESVPAALENATERDPWVTNRPSMQHACLGPQS